MISTHEQKFVNLISSRLHTDPQLLQLDEDVFERFGVDSFQVLDILCTIETEFEITIREDQIRDVKTVRDLLDLVTYHLSHKRAKGH